MGEATKIEWADHTFNPWWGCTKISPGCDHCYAEAWAKRTGAKVWGNEAPRREMSEQHWRLPHRWNEQARKAGTRPRVFCASMADVFELHDDLGDRRARLWWTIAACQALDWLLLTKRIGVAEVLLPWTRSIWESRDPWPHVWLGATVVNEHEVNRDVPKLVRTPAAIRFLSVEPLLGPVNLRPYLHALDWVIVGGESGPRARRCNPQWIRIVVEDCQTASVPVFVKQLGGNSGLGLRDRKGGDPNEWPEALNVREVPQQ